MQHETYYYKPRTRRRISSTFSLYPYSYYLSLNLPRLARARARKSSLITSQLPSNTDNNTTSREGRCLFHGSSCACPQISDARARAYNTRPSGYQISHQRLARNYQTIPPRGNGTNVRGEKKAIHTHTYYNDDVIAESCSAAAQPIDARISIAINAVANKSRLV